MRICCSGVFIECVLVIELVGFSFARILSSKITEMEFQKIHLCIRQAFSQISYLSDSDLIEI